MARQCGSLQSKILFRVLKMNGPDVQTICEKLDENIKNINKLSEDELCELWYHVKKILVDTWKINANSTHNCTFPNEVNSSTLALINAITSLAFVTVSHMMFIPNVLLETVIFLHSVILPKISDDKVKDKISYLLEKWWKVDMVWKERVIINAIKHLIQKSESSLKHVKRLHDIKWAIVLLKCPEDIDALLKLVHKKAIISLKEGKALMSYLFTLGERWIMGLHYNIKILLETDPINYISVYAKIYATAWLESSTENKCIIVRCIQNITFHCLCAQRDRKGRGALSEKLLKFLDSLQKFENDIVRRMMWEQYNPLLWKHLKAPGSYVRCNAAEVLFTAFPMEADSDVPNKKSNIFLHNQYAAITTLLKDSDEEVCLLAVRNVLNIQKIHWSNIPKKILLDWLRILLSHTKTSSSSEIRATIFAGLIQVLSNKQSHQTLKRYLPKFSNSIYDIDKDVTEAFVSLLLHIQSTIDNTFWNIVPLSAVLEQLEVTERRSLIDKLAKLLWQRIFSKNSDILTAVQSLSSADVNINAIRKLVCYTQHTTDWNIIVNLVQTVLDVTENGSKCLPCVTEAKGSRRKKRKISSTESLEFDDSTELQTVQILLDVTCLLLVIRDESSNEGDIKKSVEDKIIPMIANILPRFFNYFKDTPVNNSVIFLFSLVPVKLIPNATAFMKAFTEQLSDPFVSDDTILTILQVFIKWENVDVIFEVIMRHLATFANENSEINSKWNCEKSLKCGLRILKHLLHEEFQSILIHKYHKNLLECRDKLWIFRSFAKTKPNNCELDDETIANLFNLHIAIISTLHEFDPVDAFQHFTKILSWVKIELVPYLPDLNKISDKDRYVNVLKSIFTDANSMILQFKVTPALCCKIVLLYCECLASSSGILFVNEAYHAISLLLNYGKVAHENGESNVISLIITKLLSAVMISITKYPEELVVSYTNNLKALPTTVNKCFNTIDSTSKNYALQISYMSILFDTAVISVSKAINKFILSDTGDDVDFRRMKLPYVSEKIFKVIFQTKKYQRLCIDILTKAISKYTNINRLSVMLITLKMLNSSGKHFQNNIRSIALNARTNITKESRSTDFDRIINDAILNIIDEIME